MLLPARGIFSGDGPTVQLWGVTCERRKTTEAVQWDLDIRAMVDDLKSLDLFAGFHSSAKHAVFIKERPENVVG